MLAPPSEPALELRHISKRFGHVQALSDITVAIRPGTVHALLGENGAGKSTLMHIAYGMSHADAGVICVRGKELRIRTPLDAIAAGIGMVHQHFTLVPAMTVAENLALGGHGMLSASTMRARVDAISDRTGFALDSDARVETLSVGAQQRVEIAKALAGEASVLILDEPTAVLAPTETEELLAWLRDYASQGHAVVLITHKLREAFSIADDITVLRQGHVVMSAPAAATSMDDVSHAMVGSTSAHTPRTHLTHKGDIVFDARGVSVRTATGALSVQQASCSVYAGELVGMVGVEGAGHRELLRALAGRLPLAGGTLQKPPTVGFVPEDRHADAVMLDRSLAENIALRGAGTRKGRIGWSALRERTTSLMRAFDVRASRETDVMRSLSGGNQQKLVLAREMSSAETSAGQKALVVENPTRGLDVRATADVQQRLRDACDAGAAVVMYSSDVDEVLAVASRVLVVFDGSVRDVPTDRDAIGRAMVGLD